MDSIQKFYSDIEKIKKHYRSEHQSYNAEEVCKQVVSLFERNNGHAPSLAQSFASYWLNTYIIPSSSLADEPTAEHTEILGAMEALLQDPEESWSYTECLSSSDWKELCSLTNYEAEELPLELLSSLMKIFVDEQAL